MSDSTRRRKQFALSGRSTNVDSTDYRLRRVHDLIVIESMSNDMIVGDPLLHVVEQALAKSSRGLIFHMPTPTYITSEFIRALREISNQIIDSGCPYLAVIHPKLRLLLDIFGLQAEIPCAGTLVEAIQRLAPEAFNDI